MPEQWVLSVSISHNASAAVMRNGEVIAAALEERCTRQKNYVGYPKHSIDFCLAKAGITGSDLARAAYTSTESSGLFTKARPTTAFSLRDYIDYYGSRYYGRKIRGEDCSDYLRWLHTADQFNGHESWFDFGYLTEAVFLDAVRDVELFRAEQARTLGAHIGLPAERIEFLDHHACHAWYAYFASPFRNAECIALTLDGWGDGRNMTVWRVADDRPALLCDSAENDLGRIYKMATLILGMRPDEHEYKLMGLAPYAHASQIGPALAVLDRLSQVSGMRLVHDVRPPDLYQYLLEGWKDQRFDNVAAAVQAYTERMACTLVRDIARETGVRRFVVSGGIALNVKMNKAISELAEVESLFVAGSGGDESLSIGGCYLLNDGNGPNRPLRHLYLGRDIDDEMPAFDPASLADRFDVIRVDAAAIAALLARGEIVAIARGRAEFGARALGNRSILAHPGWPDTVRRINGAIKHRDFWMPFALSILSEHRSEYVVNPKDLASPFMTISLDTRPERYADIAAGTHPCDRTVRPQFVSVDDAPAFHRLILEFHRLTGIPALLNTSFNLHGEPIVDSIEDAVRTLDRSGLDHLYLQDSVLISKRRR